MVDMDQEDDDFDLFSDKEKVEKLLYTEEERAAGKVNFFETDRRMVEFRTAKAEKKRATRPHDTTPPEVFDVASVVESKDKDLIKRFVEQLSIDGWAFVSLPEDVRIEAEKTAAELNSFFAKSEEEKKKFTDASGRPLGYSSVRGMEQDGSDGKVFKEKITVLTREASSSFPLVASFTKLSDALLKQVAAVVLKPFHKQAEHVAEDLPLFCKGDTSTSLFDVALYLNPPSRSGLPSQANVSAHYDPGLFAFSWYSSAPGLQVFSFSRDHWLDVPLNHAVIWTGKYFQKHCRQYAFGGGGFSRYGVHRVLYADKPRLTFWSEICTTKQLDFGNMKLSGLRHDLDDDLNPDGRHIVREAAQNPGANLERLLGVPSMKTGSINSGKCAHCSMHGSYRNPSSVERNEPTLSVKCANCKLGYMIVGSSKEDSRYKFLDALYCNEQCAAADAERHAKECNRQHLKYKYHKSK